MKEFNFGVAGFYKIFVKDKDGKLHKKAEGKNLILNQGLDRWFVSDTNAIMTGCRVGTGSSNPVVTQTNLDSVLASTTTKTTNSGSSGGVPEWYYFYERTYTFALGAVVGNVTELGVYDTSSILITRALVKDELGNPTAISVTAEEQLIVIYELRKYPPSGDSNLTLTLNFNGTPTDFASVVRAANIISTSFTLWNPGNSLSADTGVGRARAYETQTLGAETSFPSGTSESCFLNSAGSYVNGTFYRDYTANFELTQGNFASGIGTLSLFGSNAARDGFQMNFTPKIPKTADRLLTIPVRLSWARI